MSGSCKGKDSWPELVGGEGESAKETIERENHWVTIIVIVVVGSSVTNDYRCDRVRIWVNRDGRVTQVPKIG
ncbi:hypothetical protein K1719_030587 [Acacia pycnantha]|nr:hypothetical protein K1719_030587 [Acacia pycnantha]